MKIKEQEALLKYLGNKKYPLDRNFIPTQYSWRIGYNQAIHDISQHIKNQRTPKLDSKIVQE